MDIVQFAPDGVQCLIAGFLGIGWLSSNRYAASVSEEYSTGGTSDARLRRRTA
jgi:hypothetical protein